MNTATPLSPADQAILAILDAAKKTGDFVLEQAPDVVHQLLTYYTLYYAVWITVWSILLLLSGRIVYIMIAAQKATRGDTYANGEYDIITPAKFPRVAQWDDTPRGMLGILGSAIAVVSFFSLGSNGSNLLKILVAPKIWLIEYASKLVS